MKMSELDKNYLLTAPEAGRPRHAPLKLDQLETFLIAAQELNFTRTARRLSFSQSAVSQQIRELELALGTPLFERRGRQVLLTPAGERLQGLAAPLLRDAKHLWAELEPYRDVPQGVLRLGATVTPGVYLLPQALGGFGARHPGIRLSLVVNPLEATLALLDAGELDCAFVEGEPPPAAAKGYEREVFALDELVLIVSPEHRWAGRSSLEPAELVGEPMLFRRAQSLTRQRILEGLASAGVAPGTLETRFELDSTEGIKHAVMAGLGVGFVSRHAIAVERRAGLLVEIPLAGLTLERTLWLLRPPRERSFPALDWFCAYVAEGRRTQGEGA